MTAVSPWVVASSVSASAMVLCVQVFAEAPQIRTLRYSNAFTTSSRELMRRGSIGHGPSPTPANAVSASAMRRFLITIHNTIPRTTSPRTMTGNHEPPKPKLPRPPEPLDDELVLVRAEEL